MKNKIIQKLTEHGFEVLEDVVDGKNQTRFYHFVLQKDENKYFGKVNITDNVLEDHKNTELSEFVTPENKGNIKLIRPIDRINLDFSDKKRSVQIFEYLDQIPVSRESQNFKDFNVSEEDLNIFLESILDFIEFISVQKVITYKNLDVIRQPKDKILYAVSWLEPSTPRGLDILKFIEKLAPLLDKYSFSYRDLQFQNMFWNSETKVLEVIDTDAMGAGLTYFDYAKIVQSVWCIYGRKEMAMELFTKIVSRIPKDGLDTFVAYFKFSTLMISLIDRKEISEMEVKERIDEYVNWVLDELLLDLNKLTKA